jgi:hypothetical protein
MFVDAGARIDVHHEIRPKIVEASVAGAFVDVPVRRPVPDRLTLAGDILDRRDVG